MTIQVAYADWHVGDGDEAIRVGHDWDVTIEAQRPRGATPNDWHTRLDPSQESVTGLWAVDGEPAEHRLVGDVVEQVEHDIAGAWVGLQAAEWRLAAPGAHSGRVRGRVVLNHDTHSIEDAALRSYATQRVEVVSIVYVAGRFGRVAPRWASVARTGWESPRAVADTHELGLQPPSGVFVIACRRSS